MPTYEYRCSEGHEFEKQQSIKDEPLKECEVLFELTIPAFTNPDGSMSLITKPGHKCTAPVERLISKTSFVLKGGGWTGKTYA